MDVGAFREFCLSFPNATEHLQWESLVFKVGGRIFAILALEPARVWLTLKASPESFLELTERPGIIPAPYLARAKWIALETRDAVPPAELRHLDVQKDQVGREEVQRSQHLSTVPALASYHEFGERGQELADAAPRRRLVVGDQHAPPSGRHRGAS